jgi:hypothetical protein
MFIVFATYQNCSSGFSAQVPGTSSLGGPTLSGDGHFVDLNPFKASGDPSLSFGSDFTAYLSKAKITNLQASAKWLSNGRIAIDRDGAFASSIAKPTEELLFSATDPKFQQVNTYYHIDNFLSDLSTDGSGPATAPLVHIDTHCKGTDAANNAYFEPSTMNICLGSATVNGTVAWGANDADVSVHEFGHSINHALSSTDILDSSLSLSTLDEGISDVWAFLKNFNPHIAAWYGQAMLQAMGKPPTDFRGLRDLTLTPSFPDYLYGMWHEDSIGISTVFFDLHKNHGIPASNLRRLASRVLSDLQAGNTFAEVVRYMIQESTAVSIDPNVVQTAFSARGLYRKDGLTTLTVPAANGVFIIDNHYFDPQTFSQKGNCNGALDVGETALVVVNLANSATTSIGTVRAQLSEAPLSPGVTILPGSDEATYLRFNASRRFVESLVPAAVDTTTHRLNTYLAGFFITGNSAGTYTFNLRLTAFNSIDTSPVTKTVPVTITVGSVAPLTALCPGNGEEGVWP